MIYYLNQDFILKHFNPYGLLLWDQFVSNHKKVIILENKPNLYYLDENHEYKIINNNKLRSLFKHFINQPNINLYECFKQPHKVFDFLESLDLIDLNMINKENYYRIKDKELKGFVSLKTHPDWLQNLSLKLSSILNLDETKTLKLRGYLNNVISKKPPNFLDEPKNQQNLIKSLINQKIIEKLNPNYDYDKLYYFCWSYANFDNTIPQKEKEITTYANPDENY